MSQTAEEFEEKVRLTLEELKYDVIERGPHGYPDELHISFDMLQDLFDKVIQSELSHLREAVSEQLEILGITDHTDKQQVDDVIFASNPQEVGEIKKLVWFLTLIDNLEES